VREARGHRGVVDAIRGNWAQAGVCLRVVSDEPNLKFFSVRRESHEICFPESPPEDPRLAALVSVVSSGRYRRLLSRLPGFDVSHAGELRAFARAAEIS
jgi:molybdate-binding protein